MRNIISDNGYFIVSDNRSEYNFHLIDNNFEVVSSFGKVGEGPQDLPRNVTRLQHQPFRLAPFRVLSGFSIKEINSSAVDKGFKLTSYPKDLVMTQDFIYINKDLIWGQGGSEEYKFMVVNAGNAEIIKKLPYASFTDIISTEERPFSYSGNGFWHPWWNMVVWSHISLNTIEIYSLEGKLEKEFTFGPTLTQDDIRKGSFSLLRAQPVPNGLLVMHIPDIEKLTESAEVRSGDEFFEVSQSLKVQILFFDENGNVPWRLELDRFIDDFTIDVKNKRIVAIYPPSEERNLIEYKLPNEVLSLLGL